MKKQITFDRSKELIIRGESVICKWGDRPEEKETVKTLERLNYCQTLAINKIRKAVFYEAQKVIIPDGCTLLSFDEAYLKVYAGNLVFCKTDDEGEELELSSVNELMEVRRSSEGEKILLYAYE